MQPTQWRKLARKISFVIIVGTFAVRYFLDIDATLSGVDAVAAGPTFARRDRTAFFISPKSCQYAQFILTKIYM
jgi:hypothetical protein